METSCPTINSIKSYLKVDLPKAREIHGILSGIVTVRRYETVQIAIDEGFKVTKDKPFPPYLQLLAVIDALGIDLRDCGMSAHINQSITLFLPDREYAILFADNKFIFKKV